MRFKPRARTTTYATSPDESVALGRFFNFGKNKSASQSAFHTLHDNAEALAWRIALIEKAEKTIDAQYYSWHADLSGQLLISKLIEAANRGVRVRLLLDDIHTFGADRRIATLNYHPNIEVRLFNPFRLRWSIRLIWLMEFLWFIGRLNYRMHNKLLVADNVVSIIGGRNIGDQYFGLDAHYIFRDLDLLVCGPAVNQFSQSFDVYWNSRIAKKARRIIAYRPGRFDFGHMKKRISINLASSCTIIQRVESLKTSLLSNPQLTETFILSQAQVFYDPPQPDKTIPRQMLQSLYDCSANTRAQLTIVSAYFVPSEELINSLQNLVDRGVEIQLFTNSLAAIDVTAVFSGYQRYRHRLLSMGVRLFEFRTRSDADTDNSSAARIRHSGLHAKTIIYDTSSVYVGTLNLDPRSAFLNTEAGVLVDSPELAINIRTAFEDDFPAGEFWQVERDTSGRLIWRCGNDSTSVQPSRGLAQRIANFIYSRLPIQQHL